MLKVPIKKFPVCIGKDSQSRSDLVDLELPANEQDFKLSCHHKRYDAMYIM